MRPVSRYLSKSLPISRNDIPGKCWLSPQASPRDRLNRHAYQGPLGGAHRLASQALPHVSPLIRSSGGGARSLPASWRATFGCSGRRRSFEFAGDLRPNFDTSEIALGAQFSDFVVRKPRCSSAKPRAKYSGVHHGGFIHANSHATPPSRSLLLALLGKGMSKGKKPRTWGRAKHR